MRLLVITTKTTTKLVIFVSIMFFYCSSLNGMQGDKRIFIEPSFNSQTFRVNTSVSYLISDFFEVGSGIYYQYREFFGLETTISYNIDYFTFVPAIFLGGGLLILPSLDYFIEGGAYLDYRPSLSFFVGILYKFQTRFNNLTNFYGLRAGFYF